MDIAVSVDHGLEDGQLGAHTISQFLRCCVPCNKTMAHIIFLFKTMEIVDDILVNIWLRS